MERRGCKPSPRHINPLSIKMTNKQYLTKALSGLNVTEDDIEIILVKSELDADADVDVRGCDMATYNRMSALFKGVMQNVSEGGYSISWNMDAVKLYYNALCSELGMENVLLARPKVRSRSHLW